MSDLAGIVGRDDALFGEHRGVGLARGDVLAEEVPVEIDGGVDLLHDGVGARAEAPAPHLVAHDTSTWVSTSTEVSPTYDRTRRRSANPRQEAACHGRGRRYAGVAVGLAAVYGIGRFQRNAGDAACRRRVALAQRLAPLARGEVAAFAVAEPPLRLPDLAFRDADGAEQPLADWRGRTVLLNLWATWCVPCRKEMPALDALEGKLGGPDFEVVAVNIDTRDPDKPRAWLKEVGIGRLAYYADPSAKVFQDLKAVGAPSACRPRCWSIRPAARSARWRGRPNGRARTR